MGTSEIVEIESALEMEENAKMHRKLQSRQKYSIEDDINKLFEAIEVRNSGRIFSPSSQVASNKKAMKRPIRVSSSQASGIGISESVSLKQALRGLCISQASEMAAMKRLSKPSRFSGVSESSNNVKHLSGEFVHPSNESDNLVQISLTPENTSSSIMNLDSLDKNGKLKVLRNTKLPVVDEILPASYDEEAQNCNLHHASSSKITKASLCKVTKSASSGSHLVKPTLKKKVTSVTSPSSHCREGGDNDVVGPSTSDKVHHTPTKSASLASSSANRSTDPSNSMDSTDTKSKSREKGEFSLSSKSSIGEYSSSTSFSDESTLSGSCRPHMSKDVRWEAIRCVQKQQGIIGLKHFKLLKKIGGGDIGTVYLSELNSTNCLFALKIMDNEFLAVRKKMGRAQTEREIMQMLDHPFLPTLYVHFTTDKFSCLVMEYCPGGDLHVLRQKQPNKNFSEQAARFYVAEVLLALEYLHMLGVVYRDLKPENILVREDGHIMLSDFDLSLQSSANPTLLKSSSSLNPPPKRASSPCTESSCIDPFCLQPTWQVPCFTPGRIGAARKLKSDLAAAAQVSPLPQVVVEPTAARSNSFVGTHEYLAPEIIKGEGHGSAVDWWTFGIFLYELLYGRTPFKGRGNEDTLSNAVSQCLKFPQSPIVSSHARDLIRRLLKKEPENRLGSVKGAAEIKQHPFFEGMNWALIRCAVPPEMPKVHGDSGKVNSDGSSHCKFEMF